jgi:ATP-dependent helicase HrpA
MAIVHRVTAEFDQTKRELVAAGRAGDGAGAGGAAGAGGDADLQAIRWMIEELRVSLFAQTLGTPAPVSERRILTALDRLAETAY